MAPTIQLKNLTHKAFSENQSFTPTSYVAPVLGLFGLWGLMKPGSPTSKFFSTSWRRKCGILSSNSRRKLPKIRVVRRAATFLDLPQRIPCSQWVTWKIWMQIAKWAASKTKCSKWAWSTESYGSKSALLIVEKEVLALFLELYWSSYISRNLLLLIW